MSNSKKSLENGLAYGKNKSIQNSESYIFKSIELFVARGYIFINIFNDHAIFCAYTYCHRLLF